MTVRVVDVAALAAAASEPVRPSSARPRPPRPRPMREADWQKRVTDAATAHGWTWCHIRPARTARGWRTPLEGHPGLPDLILARDGVVIAAELKSDTGRMRPDQQTWQDALGDHGHVWRPRDWPTVLRLLSAPRTKG